MDGSELYYAGGDTIARETVSRQLSCPLALGDCLEACKQLRSSNDHGTHLVCRVTQRKRTGDKAQDRALR